MPMINNDSCIISKFADKVSYSYAEKEKTNIYRSSSNKQEPAKYDNAGKKSAKNSFGPMFKDRDHFNNMHFA